MSAVQRLELLEQQLGNLTYAAGEWVTTEVQEIRTELGLNEYASPEAVAGGVGIVLGVVVLGAVIGMRMTSACVASKRARSRALIVEIAGQAPEDDHDEHEMDQRSDTRAAAPGDSDMEDEALAVSQSSCGR